MKFLGDKYMNFYIGNNRAMISLGPLNKYKYCTFACKFCYVNNGFNSYSISTDEEIINFLIENRKDYKIVYISGDTDSFAPPRTQRAIELLEKILEFVNVDVLFTTRTVFDNCHLEKLKSINEKYKRKNKKLYVCISIPRLNSCAYIESKNTPTPQERINCIKNLYYNGIETILAMRPFLPVIQIFEYKELINCCKDYVKVVLGEGWYADDKMIKSICQEKVIDNAIFLTKKMDFDNNIKEWKYYEPQKIIEEIEKYCEDLNIKFFMRSAPAIKYLKGQD